MPPQKKKKKKTTTTRPSSKAHPQKKPAPKKKAALRRKRPAASHPAPAPLPPAPGPAENPAAKALARKIASVVADKKASEVVILDVRGKTSYADYFVIASGESERQVTAMSDAVLEKLKAEDDRRPLGTEGEQSGQWVLLDFGEVVCHLFFSEVRAFYDLEGLWADAPREKVA